MDFAYLMRPLAIKKTTFPNRIVFPPVQTDYASREGFATERLIRFHERIARNKVGLSIVGATGISPTSRLGPNSLCLYSDAHVEAAAGLFETIAKAGSIPAVQLNHGGRVLSRELARGDPVGPSANPSPARKVVPKALSIDEIEEIIGQFVRAAENAKRAGARMVEFHGAHSFLLNQFMSPAANRRKDRYGGGTANRARIVREILEGARERVGSDFILGLRISAEEYVEGGLSVDESADMVAMFVDSGLDVVHVSGGGVDSGSKMIQEAARGNLLKLAGRIKQRVDIPVIGVGGVLRLEQAESALREGLADMISMGRALIADPELVTKTLEGRIDEVVACSGCLECFGPREAPGLACSLNEDL